MKKVLLFLFLFSSLTLAQRADFFKEDLTFRLDSTHFDVNGFYWFLNNNDKPVFSEIFYPFPSAFGSEIDSIRLFNISAGQKTKYNLESGRGIYFNLYILPGDTVLFQIGYRQKLNSDGALYILRSTQAWGKPLKHAEYKLITSKYFKIREFSYKPEKIYNIEDKKIYYWKMENFMPQKDMAFIF